MSKSIRSYYRYLYREQLDFRYRLYLLKKEKNLKKRLHLAQDLISRATTHGLGIYSSQELEQPFLDLAKTISVPNRTLYAPNSFLHVLTQTYTIGGHTRVVERWIDSSSRDQKHSIIILNQGDVPFPDYLKKIVAEHQGNFILLHESDLLKRAKELRKIAMSYEYVILHIHMDDPTAIVAFGTNEFTRPVILFNHADHSYWCGASIVDMLADLRDNDFALVRRGIKNVSKIRIPFEPNILFQNYHKSKVQSRQDLGLPLEKKIILTVGSPHKFEPFAGCEYCAIVLNAISKMDDVICYAVGPESNIGGWNKYGSKFNALGPIKYGPIYYDYLNACDIYIDSMPIGGATAILDAIQFRKPVLSYSPFKNHLGNIIVGIKTINDLEEFIIELQLLLSSNLDALNKANEQYKQIFKYHSVDVWLQNVHIMLKNTPNNHKINHLKIKNQYIVDDLAVLISGWHKTISKKCWNIYDIYHQIRRLLKM